MDDDWARPLVRVPVDVASFRTDMAALRTDAERAGRAIEYSLTRAVRTGKLGFEDLKRTALEVLGQIAAMALTRGIGSLTGAKNGMGLGGLLGALIGAGGGFPGRATGGPVVPQRPYWVGERGPELFVPTASGRIEPAAGGARSVNVAIRVQAEAGSAPEALRRSSRQVARAVRAAMAEER